MKKTRKQSSKDSETVRFGLYLDRHTRTELLHVALDQHTSATKLLERLIRQFLARRKRRLKER